MPNNQDKTETTPTATISTPTQDNKPSAGLDTTPNKPAAPANAPGRMEPNKQSNKPDNTRTPDANKQADSDRQQKFGKDREQSTKNI